MSPCMAAFSPPPDNLSDTPPPLAARLERARRAALDFLFAHNYRLHIPALADGADSLGETLGGDDETLQSDIFKMTDTLSGRALGIRADHTPQTARFDAALGGDAPRRLCYCGPALRTRPPQPWKQRELMQLGAEIFGAPPPAADWEIVHLAAGVLRAAGVADIAVDLGHPGLLRQLMADGIADSSRARLLRQIARRDIAALHANECASEFLIRLSQTADLAEAKSILAEAKVDGREALSALSYVAARLRGEGLDVAINFSDIGGYGYHTGVVFSAYGADFVAARGGRYDRPGFRPATGFSADLREIILHSPPEKEEELPPVLCPICPDDPAWRAAVAKLRVSRRVQFDSAPAKPPLLEKKNSQWKVREQ